jgi:hypothetical protein
MDFQMAQHILFVLLDHLTVAAAVHVIKIVVMDAPALSMALASATSVPLVAWAVQPHGTWSHSVITATLATFNAMWATTMLGGLPTFVMTQYTGLICVLEEHLDHTMLNMTAVLITFQWQDRPLAQSQQDTALAANICV